MTFPSNDVVSGDALDPIGKARDYTILVIDTNETRSQHVARIVTLAGLRAIVASTPYQAFERFLQEKFIPRVILCGQQEDATSPLFARFIQRLKQEIHREIPTIVFPHGLQLDGNLLVADEAVSNTTHSVSSANKSFLEMIWQVLPSVQFSLQPKEGAMVLKELPRLGLTPHIAHNKFSTSFHFYHQLKAAKQMISEDQWDMLLTDVGLAKYRMVENWPALDNQYTIPPEYTSCLNRAVMFSNPLHPAQHVYNWSNRVDAEILQKAALIFVMQQVPKVIGHDLTLRTLFNFFVKEMDTVRGEKLADWKRLEDGSFIFVLYSNMFAYGFMGAIQPQCYVWLAAFDRTLEIVKLQKSWQVREIECSCQTHTGHCVFQFTTYPKT